MGDQVSIPQIFRLGIAQMLLFAVGFPCLAFCIASKASSSGFRLKVVSIVGSISRWRRAICSRAAVKEESSQESRISLSAERRLEELRVQLMKTIAGFLEFMTFVLFIARLITIAVGEPDAFTDAHDVTLVMAMIPVAILSRFPNLICPASLNAFFFTCIFFVTIRVWTMVDFPGPYMMDVMIKLGPTWMPQFLLSAAIMRAPVVGTSQVIILAGSICRFYPLLSGEHPDFFYALATMEAFKSFVVTVASACLCHFVRDNLKKEAGARDLMGKNAAMEKLLQMMCDCVVELDSNMVIHRDRKRLATMLMMDPGKDWQNTPFSSYMSREDAARFEHFVQQHTGESSDDDLSIGAFHATLRDSQGQPVLVEILFVTLVGHDDQRGFLVGLREFADTVVPEVSARRRRSQSGASSLGSSPSHASYAEGVVVNDANAVNIGSVTPRPQNWSRLPHGSLAPIGIVDIEAGVFRTSASAENPSPELDVRAAPQDARYQLTKWEVISSSKLSSASSSVTPRRKTASEASAYGRQPSTPRSPTRGECSQNQEDGGHLPASFGCSSAEELFAQAHSREEAPPPDRVPGHRVLTFLSEQDSGGAPPAPKKLVYL